MSSVEIAPKYKDLAKSIARSGQILLELARHPECDIQRLGPHIQQYRENYQSFSDLTENLRKRFPQSNLPWWNKLP